MLQASLIQDPISPTVSGGGLGSQLTILTLQNSPTESGCVGFNGTTDVFANAICGGGNAGDVMTGASQSLTRTVGAIGWNAAVDVGIVFNPSEPGGNSINLQTLTLYIYSPTGTVLFTSGPSSAVNFADTNPGVGNAGFLFSLDLAQQVTLDSSGALSNANNRVGLFASISDSAGGLETLFASDLQRSEVNEPIPEPAPMALVGGALIAVGLLRRRHG